MERVRTKLEWFKTTILPYQGALRARLKRLLPPDQDPDDFVSEVLARAYGTTDWWNITAGAAYLFTIARNLIIDMARRDKIVSFETIADLELLQSGHSIDAQLCARDELRRLQTIMEDLPTQCRRVFLLRRVHEKSLTEIAVEMDLSVSTVEKHLAKAIMLVTCAIAEREETDIERARAEGQHQEDDRGRGRKAPGQTRA